MKLIHLKYYQWDQNHKLHLPREEPSSIVRVDFAGLHDRAKEAYSVEVCEADGDLYVPVPNQLLQTAGTSMVYLYCKEGERMFSVAYGSITVLPREKPSDYVAGDDAVLSWKNISRRVDALEAGGGGSISLSDDGAGNVMLTRLGGTVMLTDDGAGNVILGA